MNTITNLGDKSTDAGQSNQNILYLPGSARVRNALPPSPYKRRSLQDYLMQINDAVNMRVVYDNLYESIFGQTMSVTKVRELYGVGEGESLRRALAEQSPLYYSALREAELRLEVWLSALAAAGTPMTLNYIYFAVANVGASAYSDVRRFLLEMERLIPTVEYDIWDNTFERVEEPPPETIVAPIDDDDIPF